MTATRARRATLALACVVALGAGPASAEPIENIPNPRLRNGWVTDLPGVLRADTIEKLNVMVGGLERATGVEMAEIPLKVTQVNRLPSGKWCNELQNLLSSF